MKRFVVVALLCSVCPACIPSRSESGLRDAMPLKPEFLTPIVCDAGELTSFELKAVADKPEPSTLGLPPSLFFAADPYTWLEPSPQRNLRLDVCVTDQGGDQSVILRRIVVNRIDEVSTDIIVPTASAAVSGLADALFGDIQPNFSVVVPFELIRFTPNAPGQSDARIFVMRPLAHGQGVVAYVGEMQNGVVVPYYNRLIAGSLGVGDSISDSRCALTEVYRVSHFKIGDASIQTETCDFSQTTGTRGIRVAHLVVERAGNDARIDVTDPHDVGTYLKMKINHHNGCDSFVLRIDEYAYAATARAAVGNDCGETLSLAPKREASDPMTVKAASYKDGQLLETLFLPCEHFFLGACL